MSAASSVQAKESVTTDFGQYSKRRYVTIEVPGYEPPVICKIRSLTAFEFEQIRKFPEDEQDAAAVAQSLVNENGRLLYTVDSEGIGEVLAMDSKIYATILEAVRRCSLGFKFESVVKKLE